MSDHRAQALQIAGRDLDGRPLDQDDPQVLPAQPVAWNPCRRYTWAAEQRMPSSRRRALSWARNR